MATPETAGASAPAERKHVSLRSMTSASRLFGWIVTAVFFGVGGVWAATAPIASAAIAPGQVSPDGSRRIVQHLEGGIIDAIHVADGDLVQVGDPLITLTDIRARAERDVAADRYIALLATQARLQAELADAETLELPPQVEAQRDQPDIAAILDAQATLFETRMTARRGRDAILRQRITQIDREITGLEAMIASQDEQIELITQEIAGTQRLYDQGLAALPRLLALRRARAELQGARASNEAEIARNEQTIGEIELRLVNQAEEESEEIETEMEALRVQIGAIANQLPHYEDVLERTVLRSPISGRVLSLRYTTINGVVRPGEPILDIVPDQVELLIDVRLSPQDIDAVAPGMTARVALTAYNQRTLPKIDGIVRDISADALFDERSGASYYLARVAVDAAELQRLGDLTMVAGMPAEVMIRTGERTFFGYLFEPIARTFNRAFRET